MFLLKNCENKDKRVKFSDLKIMDTFICKDDKDYIYIKIPRYERNDIGYNSYNIVTGIFHYFLENTRVEEVDLVVEVKKVER